MTINRKKPPVYILICLLVLSLFSGCVILPASNTTAGDKPPLPSIEPFRVYYLNYDPITPLILTYAAQNTHCEAVGFATPNDMDSQVEQDIKNGTAPDLILLNRDSGIDAVRMAEMGLLENFAEYIEKDTTYDAENYYGNVMNAGIVNGGQYVLPMSFYVPFLVSSEETMARYGILMPEQPTWEDIFSALRTNAEDLAKDDEHCALAWLGNNSAGVYRTPLLLGIAGYDVTLHGAEGLLNDGARAALDFQIAINDDYEKSKPIVEAYRAMRPYHSDFVGNFTGENFAEAVLTATFPMGMMHMADEARFYDMMYQTVLWQKTRLIPLPTQADPNSYHAFVSLAAIIPVTAEDGAKQSAYEMVRTLMDSDSLAHLRGKHSIAVSRAVTQRYLEEIAKDSAGRSAGDLTIEPLSEELKNQIQDVLDNISGASLTRKWVEEILANHGMLYQQGRFGYEEFVEEVTMALNDYNAGEEFIRLF